MINFLKSIFNTPIDPLIEGQFADTYTDPEIREGIAEAYRNRWYPDRQIQTPASNPELYDPLSPPEGWRYDPYYECWVYLGQ